MTEVHNSAFAEHGIEGIDDVDVDVHVPYPRSHHSSSTAPSLSSPATRQESRPSSIRSATTTVPQPQLATSSSSSHFPPSSSSSSFDPSISFFLPSYPSRTSMHRLHSLPDSIHGQVITNESIEEPQPSHSVNTHTPFSHAPHSSSSTSSHHPRAFIDMSTSSASQLEEQKSTTAAQNVSGGQEEDIDDEVTILEVRRSLHLPLHPTRIHHPHSHATDHSETVHVKKRRRMKDRAAADASSSSPPSSAVIASSSSSPLTAPPSSSPDEKDPAEDQDVCSICLCPPEEPAKPDACSHLFCKKCLQEWTKIQLRSIYQTRMMEIEYAHAHPMALASLGIAVGSKNKKEPTCPACRAAYTKLQYNLSSAHPRSKSLETILPLPRELQPYMSAAMTFGGGGERGDPMDGYQQRIESYVSRLPPNMSSAQIFHFLTHSPLMHPSAIQGYTPYGIDIRAAMMRVVTEVLQRRSNRSRRSSPSSTDTITQSYLDARAIERDRRMRGHANGIEEEEKDGHDEDGNIIVDNNRSDNASSFPSNVSPLQLLSFPTHELSADQRQLNRLYHEARYRGGWSSMQGRLRIWSDLPDLSNVPAQPDVVWALRQVRQRVASNSNEPESNHSSSSSSSSSSNMAPYSIIRPWLHSQLSAILLSPSAQPDDHVLLTLILHYLDQLADVLIKEKEQGERRRQRKRQRRTHAASSNTSTARPSSSPADADIIDISDEREDGNEKDEASRRHSPDVNITRLPSSLSLDSFSPSPDVPVSTPPTASSPPNSTGNREVIVLDEHDMPMLNDTSSSPLPHARDVITLDEDSSSHVEDSTAQQREGSLMNGEDIQRERQLAHLHTLFALSTPLTLSVEILLRQLFEFLGFYADVFIRRLLLLILARAYSSHEMARQHALNSPYNREAYILTSTSSSSAPIDLSSSAHEADATSAAASSDSTAPFTAAALLESARQQYPRAFPYQWSSLARPALRRVHSSPSQPIVIEDSENEEHTTGQDGGGEGEAEQSTDVSQ